LSQIRLTPRLCRAARSLLGWRQSDLASQSGVPEPTISAFEAKEEAGRLATMNNKALLEALEAGGLQFIPENGGGAGVRFAKPTSKGEGA
jgi:transcriptional regulator with XRE-family HTH domain